MMNILSLLWNNFLLQPLLNALIWIYSNITDHNLGWAVVWLTIFFAFNIIAFDYYFREKCSKTSQNRGRINE